LPYCKEHEKLKLADTQQTKLFTIINTQGMAENGELGRRITTHLYIIVSNYSAIVGIYMVTGRRVTYRNKKTCHSPDHMIYQDFTRYIYRKNILFPFVQYDTRECYTAFSRKSAPYGPKHLHYYNGFNSPLSADLAGLGY